jgi:2-dehydro-3-deoxygluconokinase
VRALGVVGEGLVELGLEPPPDETVTLGFGGDAPNAAVMAARLGCAARIAGRVGDDTLGARLLAFWRAAGVDTTHVVVDPERPTGLYVNERGRDGPHRFDYHRRGSAGASLEPADLAPELFRDLGALHVTGITLAVSASSRAAADSAVERARASGALVSVAVNHRPALGGDAWQVAELAREADVVFVAGDEAEAVFGAAGEAALASALCDVREVVLTFGAGGCVLLAGGRRTAAPALEVELVDAAGAGDALAGAYLATRLAGGTPEEALAVGSTAAGLSCRARGCALSYPSRDEVERRLSSRPGRSARAGSL